MLENGLLPYQPPLNLPQEWRKSCVLIRFGSTFIHTGLKTTFSMPRYFHELHYNSDVCLMRALPHTSVALAYGLPLVISIWTNGGEPFSSSALANALALFGA
jgi:hypothetical protein